MKKTIIHLFLTMLVVFACSSTESATMKEVDQSKEQSEDGDEDSSEVDYALLFVGNSLTYYNDLPELVKNVAKKKGVNIETKMLARGNYAIVDHWSDGEVQDLIKSKVYDFVIIQQGPSSLRSGYNMLVNDGKNYADLCRANGVELAYFMVWPSRVYYHTFDRVIANYTSAASANGAILCPVGRRWKAHFEATSDFSYYGPDEFHPSLEGSKVAAEIIVESLRLN